MTVTDARSAADVSSAQAAALTGQWLASFEKALAERDVAAAVGLFADDGSWRDLVAFSWSLHSYADRAQIERALRTHLDQVSPGEFRVVDRVPPARVVRADREVVEAFYEFSTRVGRGEGVVRLVPGADGRYRAWTLLTALTEIRGHEPQVESRRPRTDQNARFSDKTWAARRTRSARYEDREPTVLVVGAGQAGLSTAARLRVLGVDTLVVDRESRVGDNWRKRYDSLVLHTETPVNHLPYVPFPETYPDFIPKDMLANWFESYVDTMDLNVWTSSEFVGAEYDEASRTWSARVRRSDGDVRTLRPRHIAVAVGLSGTPYVPSPPGLPEFQGVTMHSSEFTNGEAYRGKTAVVFGAGNSGCDVAQDLHAHGADVTMVQRGPMTVISLEGAIMQFALYSSGMSTWDCDLLALADPFPVLIKTHQEIFKVIREMDREMIVSFSEGGYLTWYGEDDTGTSIQYFRKGGGYYVNVGVADLIGSGQVAVRQLAEVRGLTRDGIAFSDGTSKHVDVIVFATGYQKVSTAVERLFGRGVAEDVGQLWGFDAGGELSNMFKRTRQPGLWFIAGGLPHARWYSLFTALQIQACELRLIPSRLPDLEPG